MHSDMAQQALNLSIEDGIATITLDRPEARNALSPAMKDGLTMAAAAVAGDEDVRAVVLTGAGGVFCAGGDLRGMEEARTTANVESWRERMRAVHPLIRALVELDKPLIAAVDGAAYGAGFSLALMADFVLASPRARFCLSFMRVGLVPDFAAMYTLPRVVGVQRAKELMLSAREVAADEAQRLGIVMELHAPEALLPRAMALAASFENASPLATSLIKRAMGNPGELAALLDTEANGQALAFGSSYLQQSAQRFLAKQPPAFQWPAAPGKE
jgi:2-(1,2-epoxy-1,2-dihydrophenyl)acetyl-CoA isomerase